MSTRRRDSEDEETPLLREDRYLRLTRSSQSRHRDDDEDEEEEESEVRTEPLLCVMEMAEIDAIVDS